MKTFRPFLVFILLFSIVAQVPLAQAHGPLVPTQNLTVVEARVKTTNGESTQVASVQLEGDQAVEFLEKLADEAAKQPTLQRVRVLALIDRPLSEAERALRAIVKLGRSARASEYPDNKILFTDRAVDETLANGQTAGKARPLTIILSVARSIASGSTYFFFIPGIDFAQATMATTLNAANILYWSSNPTKWSEVQEQVQIRFNRTKGVSWSMQEGLKPRIFDFVSRLGFSLTYTAAMTSLMIGIIDPNLYQSPDILPELAKRVLMQGIPGTLWYESMDKWGAKYVSKGSLSMEAFGMLRHALGFAFSLINPHLIAGTDAALNVATGLTVAGVAVFFASGKAVELGSAIFQKVQALRPPKAATCSSIFGLSGY